MVAVRSQRTPKADVMRKALEKGLAVNDESDGASVNVLLRIAKLGKKVGAKGPRNLSTHLDRYLWE